MAQSPRSHAACRPSPGFGLSEALRLWRLVVACWVVSWIAIAPALLLLRRMVFPALAAVPADPGRVPAGDLALIVMAAAREATAPLGIAVASAGVALWAWLVLWHAGVVSWRLWTGGRRVRLGEVLGLGMVAWWRYARLSATALVALAGGAAVLWIPMWAQIAQAFKGMAEPRMIWLLGAGIVVSKLLAIAVWLATLHGAWLLGLPERRSAALAWLRGLVNAARMPVASLWSWLVWLVPALLVSVVPGLLGLAFPELRGGAVLIGAGLLASLVRSFCWIGMFCSFGPVTGVVGVPREQPEPAASSGLDGGAGQRLDEEPTHPLSFEI